MHKSTSRLIAGFAAAMLCLPASLRADDTDIYVNPNSPDSSQPLVMFSLDYRSNLTSTICTDVTSASCTQATFFRDAGLGSSLPTSGKLVFFDILRLSLQLVLSEVSSVKVGLMLNHNNNNNAAGPDANNNVCGGNRTSCEGKSNGGYIAMGFREVQANDANGTVAALADILAGMKERQDAEPTAQHTYQGKELFFEFFRYLTGGGIYNGHNGYTDYSNSTKNRNLNTQFPRFDWDSAIETLTSTSGCGGNGQPPCKGSYNTPIAADAVCTKIFTINFLFQVSQQEDDSDSAITAASGGMTGINLSGNNNSFETVVEYLNDRDLASGVEGVQNVTSYFIVSPNQINNTTNGYARAGGTTRALEMAENPGELVDTLRNIFQQILSVSTTFVAASVPVNVFNRAQIVDNIYIALFQADSQARPFWPGNLKKLRLVETTLNDGSIDISLVDANGDQAIATDGRIQFDALTFWTDGSALTDSDPTRQISAGSDGRHVDRGGAGQKIPGFMTDAPALLNSTTGARQMFYDSSGSLQPLNADTTTASALRTALTPTGATTTLTDAEALSLLKWIRGQDVLDDDGDSSTTDVRPWLLGDALHSRPLPINYGTLGGTHTTANPAIFIAMATNDGLMHMFRNTGADGSQLGTEVWAFMPQKAMGIQKTLMTNATNSTPLHPYGVDGAAAAFQDPDTGDTYLYFGMRRGGNAYYALNITNPLSPTLMWSIDTSTSGFEELGLTFSTPRVGYVNDNGTVKLAVIFGGGYDKCKDYLTPNVACGTAANGRGRALFVVDGTDGSLIWKATNGTSTGASGNTYTHAGLVDNVPTDVTIADTDGDGFIDRAVFGDTGGNVWRADLQGLGSSTTRNRPAEWKLTRLAQLGYHANTGLANDRRFFHAPDIVQSRDSTGAFDGVLVGAGDRADPTDRKGATTVNYFYLIKDRNTGIGTGADSTLVHDNLYDITNATCLFRQTAEECGINLSLGWKLQLADGGAVGEKALSSPVTFAGTVFFTTYIPPEGGLDPVTCGPSEGGGVLYAIKLDDGAPARNFDVSDDTAGDTSGEANTAADRTDPLASGGIPAQVVFIPAGSSGLSYIRPDLNPDDPGVRSRLTSFWRRAEN